MKAGRLRVHETRFPNGIPDALYVSGAVCGPAKAGVGVLCVGGGGVGMRYRVERKRCIYVCVCVYILCGINVCMYILIPRTHSFSRTSGDRTLPGTNSSFLTTTDAPLSPPSSKKKQKPSNSPLPRLHLPIHPRRPPTPLHTPIRPHLKHPFIPLQLPPFLPIIPHPHHHLLFLG